MKKRSFARASRGAMLASLLSAGALGCSQEVLIGGMPDDAAPDPSAPCGVSTIASSSHAEGAIFRRGSTIFWARGAELEKVPLAGGVPTVVAKSAAFDSFGSLAADATNVCWSSLDAVMKMPLGGGQPTPIVTSQNSIIAIAVDAVNVYWVEWLGDFDGRVMKAPLAGGAPTVLAPGPAAQGSLAVDDEHVYWTHRGDGKVVKSGAVMKVPKAGGAVTTIAAGQVTPTNIVVDAENVYWTALGTHPEIVKTPKAGGEAGVIATTRDRDVSFAVNGTSVYWFERDWVHPPGQPPGVTKLLNTTLERASVLGGDQEAIDIPGPAMVSGSLVPCPGGVCWAGGVLEGDNSAPSIDLTQLFGKVMRYNACP